ncbi:F-box/LRR-repeat protein 4-like isoform X2 [Physcomitrium patens]|uniref:F-box/LRR-repeat protein 4-like isoform X2 n=1 Tax=Physcomitrium patens TaxID=3218 RepID=UPI003CCCCA9E
MVKGQDLINLLPDEKLIEIMKYVDGRGNDRDACLLVCKRWRMLESQGKAVGMTLLSKTRRSGHRVIMNCEDDSNDNGCGDQL